MSHQLKGMMHRKDGSCWTHIELHLIEDASLESRVFQGLPVNVADVWYSDVRKGKGWVTLQGPVTPRQGTVPNCLSPDMKSNRKDASDA